MRREETWKEWEREEEGEWEEEGESEEEENEREWWSVEEEDVKEVKKIARAGTFF